MANKALFLSSNELKKKSLIDGSLDQNKLLQYIEVAQDIHIQNYLGGELYKKYQTIILDGTINDSGFSDYKDLLDDYIKPMLVWYAQAEIIPFTAFQVDNGGMFKHTSENSELASREDLDYLVTKCLHKAEFYSKRFIDYMCEYGDDFPEYCNTSSDENMSASRNVNFTGGLFLG